MVVSFLTFRISCRSYLRYSGVSFELEKSFFLFSTACWRLCSAGRHCFSSSVLWVKIFWVAGIIPDNFYPTFFFLAILPTTISSCVVFTASVQGNADYSLGHATLSNLMALFLVPVLWAGSCEERVAFDILVPKIIALVVLPSLAGWLLSKLFSRIAPRIQGKWHEQIPMLCIAFLVYLSLCEGISQTGVFDFYLK